jgi:hypothetical protein
VDDLGRLIEVISDHKLLTKQNAERVCRVFYDAAKVVYYRQNLWQKTQLKMKEIAGALVLVESFHSNAYRFDAIGELAGLFGQCPEAKALDYYEHHVMGEIEDACGRKIKIDEDGIRSLYKEKYTGRHIEESQNYEEVRGKRLPWIRHVLKNSKGIFEKEEKVFGSFRRTFLYTAVVSIPIEPKPQVSYYVVIVREIGNKELKLVTAYNINILNRLLKAIATAHPWGRRRNEKGCGSST